MSVQVSDPRYEILENASGPETPPYQFAKARDREEGRVVVLQILPDGVLGADARAQQEFQDGVRAAQTLDHPGILRVFGQGVAEDGDLYVVREFLRGITLQERIRRIAPFTLAVAADIAQAVAEALVAAHRVGVAHGDLRPVHVLLSPEGQIKTADFAYGVVVAAHTDDPGRVAWLAPELAPGDSSYAGDIYALGAMLYEMLTGVLPLAGATRVTSPRDINPGVPPALDGLVRKALAPQANARYRSVSSLLADLQAIRDALRNGKSLAWSPQAEKSGETPAEVKVEKRFPRPSAEEATLVGSREGLVGPASDGAISSAARELEEERYPMRERELREREPSSVLGRVTAAMIVIAVLFMIGLSYYFVKEFAVVPDDIQVPNLIGKTFDDAKHTAEQQHFTLIESQGSDFSDTMPENQIYQQNPLPGRTIKAEKEVTVYRSLGPRLLVVPALVGTTQDYASRALQQANLPLGDVAPEFSERIAAGVVTHQSPDGGSKVARNTAVNFTVSKGKQPPDSPESMAGDADGPDKANLHWHSVPRAESYTVLRSLDGDTKTIARGLTDTRFTDTELKPDTTYSYTVNAVNSAGPSGPSESVLVTTQAKPDVPLVMPPNAVVTPAPDAGPTPDASGASVVGDGSASSVPKTARLRQFTVEFRVPRRPRHTQNVQIDLQDVTGTNLVYDENQAPGEKISVPLQGFGNRVKFSILLDGKLVKQQTL